MVLGWPPKNMLRCVGVGNTRWTLPSGSMSDRNTDGPLAEHACTHAATFLFSASFCVVNRGVTCRVVSCRLAELSEQALEKVRAKRARLALDGDRYIVAPEPLTDEE